MPDPPAAFTARVLESLAGFVYVYDLHAARNVYVSPRWWEEFGYTQEETRMESGELLPHLIHPDDLAAASAHHDALRTATDDRPRTLEYRVRRKDGNYVWVSSVDRPMDRDADGRVLTIAGHAHDITAQKTTELAEAEGRASFQAIVEHLPDAVFIIDAKARVLQVNDAACEQLGYTREQLCTMGVQDFVPPAYHDRVRDRLGTATGAATVRQSAHLRSDGSVIPVETVVVGIELEGKPAFMGVARDISERQLLEAQLREAQRMEAIGRLAGSVAHDFNNVLTAILGGAELLLDTPEVPAEARGYLEEMAAAATRGADLTRQLLTFGRRQPTHPRAIDAAEAIEATLRVLRRLVDPTIEVRTEMAAGQVIAADPVMFDQVVMNLALNARDAMPAGGTLTLSVGSAPGAPESVQLVVADTGEGIAPEHLPLVFEPFFTTKGEEQGTGIGLATVYGIVTQHDAEIRVQSELGEGTRFVLHWPRAAAAMEPASKPTPVQRADSRPRTVLLVEDIDVVRGMVERLLRSQGHRVYSADGPAAAERLLAAHGAEVDLLLSDVSLGADLDGPALANQLRTAHPGLQVVLMSGHGPDVARIRSVQGAAFLQKPFTLERLHALLA